MILSQTWDTVSRVMYIGDMRHETCDTHAPHVPGILAVLSLSILPSPSTSTPVLSCFFIFRVCRLHTMDVFRVLIGLQVIRGGRQCTVPLRTDTAGARRCMYYFVQAAASRHFFSSIETLFSLFS